MHPFWVHERINDSHLGHDVCVWREGGGGVTHFFLTSSMQWELFVLLCLFIMGMPSMQSILAFVGTDGLEYHLVVPIGCPCMQFSSF